jgi:2TM domain
MEQAVMDEHERTVRAARQVDIRIGFYIHFVVFLLVCAGLVAVNWLTTPEIWWAQWPFLGWGIAVLGHALCAFTGGGPNFISRWRLRKIRELSHPDAVAIGSRRHGSTGKAIGMLLLGILIGCAAAGGYMSTLLQRARDDTRTLAASQDTLDRFFKEQEARLKQMTGEKSTLEGTVKEAEEQLRQIQTAKQSVEQALQKARDELAAAQSAKEAAERALAEAKKGTSQ